MRVQNVHEQGREYGQDFVRKRIPRVADTFGIVRGVLSIRTASVLLQSLFPVAALAVAIAILVSGWVPPASAGTGAVYSVSRAPYWQVGAFDKRLSEACRRNRFNQSQVLRYSIAYIGPKGHGRTGIAFRGWNLRDERRLAIKGLTYHFYNDGYSDCRVYVAGKVRG